MPSITQIAAQVLGEEYMWSRYLVPDQPITPRASSVTGLTCIKDGNGNRKLAKNGEEVEAFDYKGGLGMFYEYLHNLSHQAKDNGRIILVAHNGKRFDMPVLIHAFKQINVTQNNLEKLNVTFADSMKILKEEAKENPQLFTYEDEAPKNKSFSFSLFNLHKHFCHKEFEGHDACEDVKALTRVIEASLNTPRDTIASNTFDP